MMRATCHACMPPAQFGTVDVIFSTDYLANVSTEVTYNLTVLSFPNPSGPFPSDVPPAAEVIGSVRLIANSPAGSVTVEITNKFGQAWPAGTVVSWVSMNAGPVCCTHLQICCTHCAWPAEHRATFQFPPVY